MTEGRKEYLSPSGIWAQAGLVLATLLLALTALFTPARAYAETVTGTCGTSTWSINDDGVLTIGSGVLASNNEDATDFWPWYIYRERVTSVKFEGDVKGGESLSYLFDAFIALETVDASALDTSSVKNMSNMFLGCVKLTALDASGWNTASVENMSGLLSGCTAVETFTSTGWNTSKVKDMSNLFLGCTKLVDLDLSGWNTSSLENMSALFSGCTGLKNLNITGWNTSKVTNMSSVFLGCTQLVSLDLSSWNTSSVTNMSGLFSGCTGLKNLNVANWDTSKVTDMSATFSACTGLTSLNVANWKTSAVTTMRGTFSGCTGLTSLNVANWDTSNVTTMYGIFSTCSGLTSLNVSKWKTSAVTDMTAAFSACTGLKELDLSGWDVSNVTTMSTMFSGCTGLTSFKAAGWKTSSVTDMQAMFSACTALQTLDLSGWDTSAVTTMRGTFSGCIALADLNVSGWNTSQVTNMQALFALCSKLETLDLSSWDTTNVTSARFMYDNPTSLKTWIVGDKYKMTNDLVPTSSGSDGKWWSTTASAWFSTDEIVSGRSYTADTYTSTHVVTFTIKFVDYDGTVLSSKQYEEGTAASDIVKPSNPSRPATADYTYTFAGWTPTIAMVTKDATYTATYTATAIVKQYTITFADYDGTIISQRTYDEGTSGSDIVRPSDPTRPATADKIYVFAGWTPTIGMVTKDATYTATYIETDIGNTYTITWKNYDGKVLEVDVNVPAGTKPTYDGAEPTKPAAGGTEYSFAGWTPDVVPASQNATYTATFTEVTAADWTRLSGNGRYDTMAAIVQDGFKQSDWAVIATGKDFADALVAASLAGAKGCPVVLTAPAALSQQAAQELERLGVKSAYIMGGEGAVSAQVESDLAAMGIATQRIKGSSRYNTSLESMYELQKLGTFDGTVVITTGVNFADALSIGPWCFKTATPIILANKNGKLTDAQVTACKGVVKKVIIVGGSAAVSDEVMGQLNLQAGDCKRLQGSNRFATSKAIAEWEINEQGMTMASVAVATGDKFPDALAGAALCGVNASPLLLARNERSATLELVTKTAGIRHGKVLGGEGAVSAELFAYLESLTK